MTAGLQLLPAAAARGFLAVHGITARLPRPGRRLMVSIEPVPGELATWTIEACAQPGPCRYLITRVRNIAIDADVPA